MKVILCSARHHHPEIEGLPSIFTNTISMDFAAMDETASKFVKDNMETVNAEGLDLYVTGMTPAACAVIRACLRYDVELRLWHYDRDTDTYICQPILERMIVEQGFNEYGVVVMTAPSIN